MVIFATKMRVVCKILLFFDKMLYYLNIFGTDFFHIIKDEDFELILTKIWNVGNSSHKTHTYDM